MIKDILDAVSTQVEYSFNDIKQLLLKEYNNIYFPKYKNYIYNRLMQGKHNKINKIIEGKLTLTNLY